MKRILVILLSLLLAVSVLGCKTAQDNTNLSIGAMKGPTGMGLAKLMENSEDNFEITLYDAPDVVTGKFISGEIDIAAVPINLASTLYNKTEGEAVLLAINTLGVLYVLENGESVQSFADLAGKTLYATGQGSTPQYVLDRLLAENNLTDSVTVEYIAEHAALANMMAAGEATLAMLPEPNVSAVLLKNADVRVALNLTQEWDKVIDTTLIQGCYIVKKSVLDEHPKAVEAFVKAADESAAYMRTEADAASIAAAQGVVASEAIAAKAMQNCNLVCITGEEMKTIAAAMFETLYEANPASVGGKLPADDFYAKLG